MARNPMDDGAYRGYGLGDAAYLREHRDDLKALVEKLRAGIAPMNETIIKQAERAEAAEALVRELRAALEWVASHSYAGGKAFGQIEPVKSALAKSVEGEKK